MTHTPNGGSKTALMFSYQLRSAEPSAARRPRSRTPSSGTLDDSIREDSGASSGSSSSRHSLAGGVDDLVAAVAELDKMRVRPPSDGEDEEAPVPPTNFNIARQRNAAR